MHGGARAAQEVRDRVGDQAVEQLGRDDAGGDEGGNALNRREQDEADALWRSGLDRPLRLALLDQLEHHREGAFGRHVDRARAMLGGEHQLEQCCVARGEANVGRRTRPQSRLEFRAGAVGGAAKVGAETREARFGERVKQRLAIGEVPSRSAVADADLARELPQRQFPAAPRSRSVRSACSSSAMRRLPWW